MLARSVQLVCPGARGWLRHRSGSPSPIMAPRWAGDSLNGGRHHLKIFRVTNTKVSVSRSEMIPLRDVIIAHAVTVPTLRTIYHLGWVALEAWR